MHLTEDRCKRSGVPLCLRRLFQIMWHDGQHLLSLSENTPPQSTAPHPHPPFPFPFPVSLSFRPSGTCHLFMFPYPFIPLPSLRERNKQTDVFFATTCSSLHLLISAVPSAACVQAHVRAHCQRHSGFSTWQALIANDFLSVDMKTDR